VELAKDDFEGFVFRPGPSGDAAYRRRAERADAGRHGWDLVAAFAKQLELFLEGGAAPVSWAGVALPAAEDLLGVARVVEECYGRRPVSVRIRRPGRPVAVVTGASGFIGGRLVDRLIERDEHDLVLPI
jgi:hypothetical protein